MSSNQAQLDADAALARSLADQEAVRARTYEAERRRSEWDAYSRGDVRLYPYYYGSWQSRPYARPVVVYRDNDPCNSLLFVSCMFFWLIALFITIILVVYYT